MSDLLRYVFVRDLRPGDVVDDGRTVVAVSPPEVVRGGDDSWTVRWEGGRVSEAGPLFRFRVVA